MNKILIGVLLGALLGAIDGWTALLSAPHDPAVRDGIIGIIIGSAGKGLLGGAITGWYARRRQNLPLGILLGFSVALAFAFLVAYMNEKETGHAYYFEIMLPGSIVGAIVGFATQRYGAFPGVSAASQRA